MNKYRKQIEITHTGMVIASVYRVKAGVEEKVGLNFFSPFISTIKSIENKAILAHKWADDYIKMCERQETEIVY